MATLITGQVIRFYYKFDFGCQIMYFEYVCTLSWPLILDLKLALKSV